MSKADFPESYKDPVYASLDSSNEQKYGLPAGLLSSIRTEGERTNASRVSSAGAQTPYQFIPSTRKAILDKYGIDVALSPANASEGAALLLQEALKRNQGDPEQAVREYHGGTNRAAWGKVNDAYWQRVSSGLEQSRKATLDNDFASWLKANPAVPAGRSTDAVQPLTQSSMTESSAPQAATGMTPASSVAGQQPAPTDALSADFKTWLAQKNAPPITAGQSAYQPSDAVNQIPGISADKPVPPQPQPGPAPSLAERAIGAGEVGLSTITGMTGGTLGMIGGTLKGLAEQILSGQFGTPQAADLVERSAAEGQRALTYEPRTPVGQSMAETAGGLMQNLVPIGAVAPTMPPIVTTPGKVPAGVLARAGAEGVARDIGGARAAAAVGAVGDTAARMADVIKSGATTLPRRALQAAQESLAPSPSAPPVGATAANEPAPAGVGAAATPRAAQRVATAEQLGFTGDRALTVGQATRDPAQLKFEIETAKQPETGAPLRERIQNQNEHVLNSFDQWVDQTGAEAPNLRAVGKVVDDALVKQAAKDKTEINVAGAIARRSPEARAIVDQMRDVAIGEGDNAIVSTPLKYLNDQPTGLSSTKVPDAAKQYAIRIGIAEMRDGELVPNPNATVAQLEKWRQEINGATGYERADIRHATILKALIDGQTEPLAGPLFQRLRSLRTRYAQNYENIGAIDKLMSLKPGTTDRQVAFEDVWKHSILDGSLDDTRQVRRVLQRAGPDGHQAWRELQGQTMRWVQEQAFGNSATDARGNRVLSPPKLDKAIRTLDADGKLEFIFGKRGAQTLRDVNDIAKEIKTAPPESAINMSNTASTLLSSSADVALGIFTGIPAPLATAARAGIKYIKDNALRRRIAESLDGLRAQRPASSLPPAPPPRGNVAPPAPPAPSPQGATVH